VIRPFRLLLVILACLSSVQARDWRVASAAEFSVATPVPGDVIVWAPGRYADVSMRLKGEGTEAAPITVRAETPGAAVFTGASRIEASGAWLVIEWLTFEGGTIDPIFLRDARHCRVTGCTVRSCNPEGKRIHWLRIGGKSSADNRVDGCTFEDKRGDGVMLVIDGDEGQIATGTRIDHNVFRGIVKAVRNGMEAIRVGDSSFQRLDAKTTIEDNRFEDCRGDAEVVSNKSSANVFRGNVFTGCDGGAIVLRHGDRCVVEGNRIDGQSRLKSGGIRIHGDGHIVRGNTIERTVAFAIALPAGNSVPRDTGHAPVTKALIESNRILRPEGPVFVLGEPHDDKKRQDTAPSGVVFRGNVIEERGEHPLAKEYLTTAGGVRWE
jgi:poly(beta-D-mannuronate) lyase